MTDAMHPEISVVIPTYNRIGHLAETLDSLFSQSLEKDRFEVLVVDDGSTDDTVAALGNLKRKWGNRLIVLHQEHGFSGAARNLGIRSANGGIILSIDDDILADKDLLKTHLLLHRRYPDPQTAIVGRVITGEGRVDLCDPDDRPISFLNKTFHGDPVVDASAFTTQNTSVKRDFALECGLFTPGLKRLDDLDLAFRMQERGLRLIYAEHAVGIHTQPLDTLEKVIEMGKRYGRSLAEDYDRLPWIAEKMPSLGARFSGGRRQFAAAPAAYFKDTLRRLAINRLTIHPLTWAASRILAAPHLSRFRMRCCREIWAYHYRNEFYRSLPAYRRTSGSRRISFISWKKNIPRSRNLSRALGANDHYVEFLPGAPKLLLPIRYLVQTVATFRLVMRDRPDVIITMNPPLVLPLVCYWFSRMIGAKLVIDSHTGALIGTWARLLPVHRYLSRKALVTIVTNIGLKRMIDSWGADGLVLEDRLPDLPIRSVPRPCEAPAVCVINSFSEDEPIDEILHAARLMPGYRFYITGKLPRDAVGLVSGKPGNVQFTGYIPDDDYINLLNAVDLIMVLVTTDHTMVCGAYEAVALEKPLITSDWPVLRRYFNKGALYTDNSPADIARTVTDAMGRKSELAGQMRELKQELPDRWQGHFEQLKRRLELVEIRSAAAADKTLSRKEPVL